MARVMSIDRFLAMGRHEDPEVDAAFTVYKRKLVPPVTKTVWPVH
jgi:hypothetical protein